MLEKFEKKYTTIFLGDLSSFTSLILLKRLAEADVAPSLYTGIGGKIKSGESQLAGALRELKEETGIKNVELVEFARMVLNKQRVYCTFFGIYEGATVPECNEGELERVNISGLYRKVLVPTTALLFKEWERRGWDTQKPFTLYLEREDINDVFAPISRQEIKEGLHF